MKFNVHKYNDDQVIEALTDPINRHAVRTHYGVDDWWLHDHKDEVIQWWVTHGGAKVFAKRRKEYELEDKKKEDDKEDAPISTPS